MFLFYGFWSEHQSVCVYGCECACFIILYACDSTQHIGSHQICNTFLAMCPIRSKNNSFCSTNYPPVMNMWGADRAAML